MPDIDVAEIVESLAGPSRTQPTCGPGKVESHQEEHLRVRSYIRFLEACPKDVTVMELLEAFIDFRR